jgi:hypothetical protein
MEKGTRRKQNLKAGRNSSSLTFRIQNKIRRDKENPFILKKKQPITRYNNCKIIHTKHEHSQFIKQTQLDIRAQINFI